MLTVACVLNGGEYTEAHVERLQGQVAAHMRQPYRFEVLYDQPLPGWWGKIYLFKPGTFEGRVLYLDLDVTITGNLDEVAEFGGPFCIMKDPNRIGFNSSVMAWDAGAADDLWSYFNIEAMARLHGDQNWIEERKPEAWTFPTRWLVSYKKAKKLNKWPEDMRVCVYHGLPKPWDLENNGPT